MRYAVQLCLSNLTDIQQLVKENDILQQKEII